MKSEVVRLKRQLAACEKALEASRDLARRRQRSMEDEYERAEENKHLANANANRACQAENALEQAQHHIDGNVRAIRQIEKERDQARAGFRELYFLALSVHGKQVPT